MTDLPTPGTKAECATCGQTITFNGTVWRHSTMRACMIPRRHEAEPLIYYAVPHEIESKNTSLDVPERDAAFDQLIGQLDFVLSSLMKYARKAAEGKLSSPNTSTLLRKVEYLEVVGAAIIEQISLQKEDDDVSAQDASVFGSEM